MDFSHSEAHQALATLVDDLMTDYGEVDRLRALEAEGPYFDRALWRKLLETGLVGAALPQSMGGMALDFHAVALVAEALGRHLGSVPYIPCLAGAMMPLLGAPDHAILRSALEKVVDGQGLLVAGLIEPGNEEPLEPSAVVVSEADDTAVVGAPFRVDGVKHCVPYAADADALLISARLQQGGGGDELWLGLVPLAQDGVMLIEQRCTANEPQYQVTLRSAQAYGIAVAGSAAGILRRSVALSTVAYCSMAVGVAEKMMKISAEYTSQRQQFGRPIATFQAVAHRLASCYIDTECLRIMVLKAADEVDRGCDDGDAVVMAKAWCGDVMHRVSHACQHVHGGMGIDRDYPLFRYCLWAKQLELTLGGSKVQLDKLADSLEARYLDVVAGG